MESRSSWQAWKGQVLYFFSFCIWGLSSGKLIRYSVSEESEPGTLVGNLGQDLGLNVAAISNRRLRLGSEGSSYFAVNRENGALSMNKNIDRESLCGSSSSCLVPVEVVIETPLELFRLEVEILDINDNSPKFVTGDRVVKITEVLATPGTRFPLESAQDADVGTNSVSFYTLNPNQHFSLNVKHLKDGKLLPELVLEKALDREEKDKHELVLTAFDGGNSALSGTAHITVIVMDVNDNAPVFDHSVYKVRVRENAPVNSVLIQLNASDLDDGLNGELEYSFEDHISDLVQNLFELNTHNGEIRIKGDIDYEESCFHEIHVKARDKGVPEMEGHSVIQLEIEDVNDNSPEILLSSLVHSIPESTPVGTAVGFFTARDRDSSKGGEVRVQIPPHVPFKLKASENHYTIVTDGVLDREKASQYILELTATDLGSPSLQTRATIILNISDINDNSPKFSQTFYNVYIKENNLPGSLLCTMSASDPDEGDNSHLTYSIAENQIHDSPISSFVYINSHSGNIYAQRSFDHESLQVLQITVRAEDAGWPKLCSNVTVYIYILDQNDNSPIVLYPVSSNELSTEQRIPKSSPADYLVTKVTAVDADSGHNAWLSYSLLQAKDPSLFRVAPYTGEVRTSRDIRETDLSMQRLLILIKDNGDPVLSTTVTILVALEENETEEASKSRESLKARRDTSHLTLYLTLSLVGISIVSLATFIILYANCLRKGKKTSDFFCCSSGPEPSHFLEQSNQILNIKSNSTLKFMDVSARPTDPESQTYKTCLPPSSNKSDFTFMKPLNFHQLRDMVNETNAFLSGNDGLNDYHQQAQPNTEWRFSQAQRPGTSGSQNTEEGGVWPNNQLETERLQAMILASANEAADGNSTLGGAAGTMGLSTRYGPQFTLQHVPDYRQNVYIPGNTATLTNSAGKRDGKGSTSSGGNKKKSGKKEKK